MADKQMPVEVVQLLNQELGLQLPPSVSEEEIVLYLAHRISLLLQSKHGSFFQIMYRLDISEKKLSAVIDHEDAPYKIAWLVYDRQIEKYRSRQQNKPGNIHPDKDLEW